MYFIQSRTAIEPYLSFRCASIHPKSWIDCWARCCDKASWEYDSHCFRCIYPPWD